MEITSAALNPRQPLSQEFREAVSELLMEFVDRQAAILDIIGPELGPVHRMAGQLVCGGKRVRPGFCWWGYIAAAGEPAESDRECLLRAAASLDVLHVSALVHDDVMDASDLRRGKPSAHRQFEAFHANAGWLGDPAAFGRAGSILLGDLLTMWSVQMLQGSGVSPSALQRALPIAEAMRTEVVAGQYLDIVAQVHPLRERPAVLGTLDPGTTVALEDASRVVEYKAARYTVQRPSQIGAALGCGSQELHLALAAFGSPLGRAFQFRDDLLGVFGNSQVTGKPSGDDLREGKRTVLIAHAFANADAAGKALLQQRLGDPELDDDAVAELQQLIEESGARDAVEAMIKEGHERALLALDAAEMTELGRAGLTGMADAAVRREF